jgi:hypothetical protein
MSLAAKDKGKLIGNSSNDIIKLLKMKITITFGVSGTFPIPHLIHMVIFGKYNGQIPKVNRCSRLTSSPPCWMKFCLFDEILISPNMAKTSAF